MGGGDILTNLNGTDARGSTMDEVPWTGMEVFETAKKDTRNVEMRDKSNDEGRAETFDGYGI